ncbi:Hsp70 family protein [Glycomyces sp. NPDC048151]|uniref:Hsp70 family protein n=1 Tax=Glycomyces sp. NPDC048151 TaxID=3364002 RepID=UPI0037201F1C
MDSASRTAAALGIDFGTHHTVATVLRDDGRRHQLLFEGTPLLPSGIYLDHESSILVGSDAAREGRRRPERYERNPKLRLDATTILLGDKELHVREAVAAVLRRVIADCGTAAGVPRSVTVTVPAGWGPARRHVVEDAAASAGAVSPVLMPEPVAAARYFAEVLGHELAPGRTLVVFDMGAGTFDASAVSRTEAGFDVLAVDGSDRIGGHYLDQALVDYLGGRFAGSPERAAQWAALLDPDAGADRLRDRFSLYDEVREAKERLSRRTSTEIAVPGFAVEELLTRAELELLARPLLAQAVEITRAVIREAGLTPDQVAGVFMVGGASRMPLAATMIHQELGVAPTLIEQPELVVSEGAVSVPAVTTPPNPAPTSTPAVLPYTPVAPPLLSPPQTPAAGAASAVPTYTPAAVAAAPTQAAAAAPPTAAPASTQAPQTGTLPPPAPAAPEPDRRSPRPFTLFVFGLIITLLVGLLISELLNRDDDGDGTGGEGQTGSTTASSDPAPTPGDMYDGEAVSEWAEVAIVDTETTAGSVTIATDAAADLEGCLADIRGTEISEFAIPVPCDQFTLVNLWASDTYEIWVYREKAFEDGKVATVETTAVTGQVYWDCPQSRQYCQEQGGEPGIREVYTVADSAIGTAAVGERFELSCYEDAEEIVPRGEEEEGYHDYHPGKDASSLMIQVEMADGGVGYIPFVWLVIDPADLNSLGGLTECQDNITAS